MWFLNCFIPIHRSVACRPSLQSASHPSGRWLPLKFDSKDDVRLDLRLARFSISRSLAGWRRWTSPLSSSPGRHTIRLMGEKHFIRKVFAVLIHGMVSVVGGLNSGKDWDPPSMSPWPIPITSQCKLELEKLIKSRGNWVQTFSISVVANNFIWRWFCSPISQTDLWTWTGAIVHILFRPMSASICSMMWQFNSWISFYMDLILNCAGERIPE